MSSPPPSAPCSEIWLVESSILPETESQRTRAVALLSPAPGNTPVLRVNLETLVSAPRWDTLQVGEGQHAVFGSKALCLNHSSKPNTRIAVSPASVEIVTLSAVVAGEPLTFNYNTTEYEMAEPFDDWTTGGKVAGFKHASAEERSRLAADSMVAPHVLQQAGGDGLAGVAHGNASELAFDASLGDVSVLLAPEQPSVWDRVRGFLGFFGAADRQARSGNATGGAVEVVGAALGAK